jgi:hypothetical protein
VSEANQATQDANAVTIMRALEQKFLQAEKDLKSALMERDQAKEAANRLTIEADRLRKLRPSDLVEKDNKGLRVAVSESHKKIMALERELAAVKVESEIRRKGISQVQHRFDNVQNTFDMMQMSRDKAYADRDQALASVQQGAEAYGKLREEFEALKKAAAERERDTKQSKTAKAPEPAKA